MDEHVDILSEDLEVVKVCLKSEAHQKGWLHASVHIWFYNDNGEVLIQKRASDKDTFPNLWDVSVAGHISSNEDKLISAIREIEEEIGLKITKDNLQFIGSFYEKFHHSNGMIDNEIHYTYLSKLACNIDQLKIQKEELAEIQLLELEQLIKDVGNNNQLQVFVPHKKEYYDFVFKEIQKRLK